LLGGKGDGFGGIAPNVINGVVAVATHPALYIPHALKVERIPIKLKNNQLAKWQAQTYDCRVRPPSQSSGPLLCGGQVVPRVNEGQPAGSAWTIQTNPLRCIQHRAAIPQGLPMRRP